MSARETDTEAARRKDIRAFRVVMALFAFLSVVAGALIGFLPDLLALSPEQARGVASVLLLVGLVDTVVLLQWSRLFD